MGRGVIGGVVGGVNTIFIVAGLRETSVLIHIRGMASNSTTGSVARPSVIVIFGASGDLTKRKLIPSLYHLFVDGHLPKGATVLGVSRTKMSDDDYRNYLRDFAKEIGKPYDEKQWAEFAPLVHYHADDATNVESMPGLNARLKKLADAHQTGSNRLFYLSVAPHLYEPIINNLGAGDMVTEGKAWCSTDRDHPTWQRIIVEKPFGSDPETAAHLNRVIGRVFEEESIYRIDHYLGKETVQNLLVFRFANTIFEPIWNREYIDHIQVTATEAVGVEARGSYYDSPSGGAMRDMIQSHLLQVMAVVAMEPPITMAANDMRVERNKILAATRAPTADEVPRMAVKGQYGPGQIGGKSIIGYRESEGVHPESQTDTYAAMQLNVDTWRWGGVPFYLRSGKAMTRKLTQIVVNFKPTPHLLFAEKRGEGGARQCNQLVINVQPDEGIRIRFSGKVPGLGTTIKPVVMDFDYVEQFHAEPPEAYATLLLDAMRGDQTLYKYREEIENCWRIVQPVLDYWDENPQSDLPNYAAGTWGPSSSDIMLAQHGARWHDPRQMPRGKR